MHELREKWVAALRSGEYKQGKGLLRHADEYCCLGVLCAVAGLEYVQAQDERVVGYFLADWGRKYTTALPSVLFPALGWARISSLVTMNDAQNKTFSEIADYIEGVNA